MKKQLLVAALAACSMPSFAAVCQYPLNATAAQYASIGITSFPYISNQTVEYVTQSTQLSPSNLSVQNYMGLSSAAVNAAIASASSGLPSGDITLPGAGIVGFEFNIDNFPAYADTSSGTNQVINFGFASSNPLNSSPATGDSFAANVLFYNTPYGIGPYSGIVAYSRASSTTTFDNGAQTPLTLPLPANYRAGMYINMNTRQIGYTLNGVNKGYILSSANTPLLLPNGVQSVSLAITGLMQVPSTSPLIGTPVRGTLITDRAAFTQPFPAGILDICGNGATTSTGHHDDDGHDGHGNNDHGHGRGHDEHGGHNDH